MFKLLRYFTVMSLFSIGVAAALLGMAYRGFAERDMVELTHAYHGELAAMLASNNAFRRELTERATSAEREHSNLAALIGVDLPLSLLLLRVYDVAGGLIYSSDAQRLEQGRISVAERTARSELILNPADTDGGIVVSLTPLDSDYGTGLMELHSDVGLQLDKIARTQTKLVTSAIIVLGLLYGALLVIIMRAEKTLNANAAERKVMESHLKRLARHDLPTGLPGSAAFRERLQEALLRAAREKHFVAVLSFELNVPQMQGRPISEELLHALAKRVHETLRESDTLGRTGDNEFGVILGEIISRATVSEISEKIVHALSRQFEFEGRKLAINFWIGISLFPIDATRADMLLRGAELALKHARRSGKSVAFYQPRKTISAARAVDFPIVGEVLK
ncbi:MAG TPA: GGDEF domain-containing protein [Burkholderiales bacterium]|jgi:diguanylate cyclase (GGDEF)-like protein|nr:GGDEF domain-containing protein [Burkholderiales bacterium]